MIIVCSILIICYLGWSWKENDRPKFMALYQELCQPCTTSTISRSTVAQSEPTNSASMMPQSRSRIPLQKTASLPIPPAKPRKYSRNNSIAASPPIASSPLQDLIEFNMRQPISDNPSHVVEDISRISTCLLDISLKGFMFFKRSLEYFAQLSEKMLQLIQIQNTGHSVSMKIVVNKLRENIKHFRNLLMQINSSPSHDYNSQVEMLVSDISKSCCDLYDKLY